LAIFFRYEGIGEDIAAIGKGKLKRIDASANEMVVL
jgi:hypothetical protein